MKTKKTLSQKKEIIVINEHGEITKTEMEYVFKAERESEPAFVKLYLTQIQRLLLLKKGTLEILFELSTLTNYNKNTIILNSGIKKELVKKLKISEGTLNNAISELKKAEVITTVAGGVYLLDTTLIAKGQWSVIKKINKDNAMDDLI